MHNSQIELQMPGADSSAPVAENRLLNAGADFSECGQYRYKLWRIWDERLPLAMCIGLNPSTANAIKTDPTITNLTKMLKILGYGGFYMMNLFAWISSKPADLLTCKNAIGENDSKLKEVAAICSEVIVCWGNFKQAEERIKEVLPNYPDAKCFGKTQSGKPFHPLAMMYAGLTNEPILSNYRTGSTCSNTIVVGRQLGCLNSSLKLMGGCKYNKA